MSGAIEWLDQLMHSRRSVRSFRDDPLSEDLLRELLTAAVSAPSASNKQPWRFFVVSSRAVIAQMTQAVRDAIDEIAAHVPPESERGFRTYGDYFTRFERAPHVIVPICRGPAILSNLTDAALSAAARDRIATMERDSALIGAALALQNLLLAAHARGIGASAMTGPLVASDRLRELLAIPESWGIVALVPVGHPAEAPPPTERKSIDAVTRWIR
jgi:nitroreductase